MAGSAAKTKNANNITVLRYGFISRSIRCLVDRGRTRTCLRRDVSASSTFFYKSSHQKCYVNPPFVFSKFYARGKRKVDDIISDALADIPYALRINIRRRSRTHSIVLLGMRPFLDIAASLSYFAVSCMHVYSYRTSLYSGLLLFRAEVRPCSMYDIARYRRREPLKGESSIHRTTSFFKRVINRIRRPWPRYI